MSTQQTKSKKTKGSSSKLQQANPLHPQAPASDTMVASHRHVTAVQTQQQPSGSITEIASPPPANASRFSGPHQGRLQSLYKDSKEEQFHIKTARAFFCLQNMGSECRVSMLKSYKNPRTPRKRARHERTVFEGIFKTLSANQGELMLEASEEKLANMKTGEERTVGICLEPCIIRMNTVAHVKFVGKNITRNGIVSVPTKEDVRPSKHRSVTYTTIGTDDSNSQKEVSTPSQQDNIQSNTTPLAPQTKTAISEKDDLQTGAVELKLRDIDFPPFEGSQQVDSKECSTRKKSTVQQDEDNLPSIDELLASKLRPSPLAQTNKTNSTDEKPSKKKATSTSKKQLQRFKFEDGDEKAANFKTLHESNESGGTFDQFQGRKTNFSMDIYSVQMPDRVSPELQARANRLEKEIGQGRDEEQIFSMVDDDCQLRRERQSAPLQSEETLFGTAIQGDQKAQYKTAFNNTSAPKEEEDNDDTGEVEEANVGDRVTNRNPSTSIKDILFKSLGAMGQQPGGSDMDHLGLPQAAGQQDDMRSRNNSLRNGETSKVIENLDIELPKMDKDQIEEYLRFKASMSSSKNQATGALARDRKLSQEYFQSESKRLDKKLQEGKHLKSSQHHQSPGAAAQQSPLQTIAQEAPSQPMKRFTCFKLSGGTTPSVVSAFGLYDKITTDID